MLQRDQISVKNYSYQNIECLIFEPHRRVDVGKSDDSSYILSRRSSSDDVLPEDLLTLVLHYLLRTPRKSEMWRESSDCQHNIQSLCIFNKNTLHNVFFINFTVIRVILINNLANGWAKNVISLLIKSCTERNANTTWLLCQVKFILSR